MRFSDFLSKRNSVHLPKKVFCQIGPVHKRCCQVYQTRNSCTFFSRLFYKLISRSFIKGNYQLGRCNLICKSSFLQPLCPLFYRNSCQYPLINYPAQCNFLFYFCNRAKSIAWTWFRPASKGNQYKNVPLFFWFDHCLEVRAEIRDLLIRIEEKEKKYLYIL